MSTPTLPTGTVTFLFTDIEGSTRLWQQHPRAMKDALARHHAALHHAIELSGGYVFQIVGDAFCAAFALATDALAAALAAQRALAREVWTETGPIRVRMALHTGAAELRAGEHKSGEYVSGLTLSHVARLLAAGHGGQILVSNATHELVEHALPSDTLLRDLGQHRLRDLANAEPIYQVAVADLPDAFPALRSLDARLGNLPQRLTKFIGRESVMMEAKQRLADTHLLTLTGAGGAARHACPSRSPRASSTNTPTARGSSSSRPSPIPPMWRKSSPARSACARIRGARSPQVSSITSAPAGRCSSSTTANT